MIRVNLLPHREMRRRRQQKQFFITLGVVVALGATVWLMVHTSLAGTFEDQVARNAYLTEEIAKLDKNKTYLVHCAVGGRSARACKKMEQLGFKSI